MKRWRSEAQVTEIPIYFFPSCGFALSGVMKKAAKADKTSIETPCVWTPG